MVGPMSEGLTQLNRSLALMMLIKNLGRHSLPPLRRISSRDSKVQDEVGRCSRIEMLPIELSWSGFPRNIGFLSCPPLAAP
jgi:hypothetical protein